MRGETRATKSNDDAVWSRECWVDRDDARGGGATRSSRRARARLGFTFERSLRRRIRRLREARRRPSIARLSSKSYHNVPARFPRVVDSEGTIPTQKISNPNTAERMNATPKATSDGGGHPRHDAHRLRVMLLQRGRPRAETRGVRAHGDDGPDEERSEERDGLHPRQRERREEQEQRVRLQPVDGSRDVRPRQKDPSWRRRASSASADAPDPASASSASHGPSTLFRVDPMP